MRDKIKTIIWDLDNTLYKFGEAYLDLWNIYAAKHVVKKGLNFTEEEAFDLAHKGWIDHRDSRYYFLKNHGLCGEEFHNSVFEMLPMDHVIACADTPAMMKNMNDYRHVILTYATKDWARRVLDHTGLAEFFEPDHILGAEDYNFEDKAHSARGILTALDKIGGNADEVMFVEDTLPNLKPAKEQAGVNTVYLHHGRPMNDNEMDFVDLKVTDTPELLKWFKEIPAK